MSFVFHTNKKYLKNTEINIEFDVKDNFNNVLEAMDNLYQTLLFYLEKKIKLERSVDLKILKKYIFVLYSKSWKRLEVQFFYLKK